MPDFPRAFSSTKYNRPLTSSEVIREIRFAIAAEFEAVQIYEQIAESLPDEAGMDLVKKVLLEVADEERVHIGEFKEVLFRLAPREAKLWEKGQKEVDEMSRRS